MSSYGAVAVWGPTMPTGMQSEVRLTRRGRLARTLMMATLVLSVAFLGVDRITGEPALANSEPLVAPETASVVVEQGDSLWNIAQRLAPEKDPRDVVHEIRELNGLPGNLIHPGQVLLVPSLN